MILIWLFWRRELATGLRTNNLMGHFWRGVAGVTAMGLGFTALGLLPLPEVTALGYASPLLAVIFAAIFLDADRHGHENKDRKDFQANAFDRVHCGRRSVAGNPGPVIQVQKLDASI